MWMILSHSSSLFGNLVQYFSNYNLCISRIARDHHKIAWAALTLWTAIEDMRYIPNISGEPFLLSMVMGQLLTSFLSL